MLGDDESMDYENSASSGGLFANVVTEGSGDLYGIVNRTDDSVNRHCYNANALLVDNYWNNHQQNIVNFFLPSFIIVFTKLKN